MIRWPPLHRMLVDQATVNNVEGGPASPLWHRESLAANASRNPAWISQAWGIQCYSPSVLL